MKAVFLILTIVFGIALAVPVQQEATPERQARYLGGYYGGYGLGSYGGYGLGYGGYGGYGYGGYGGYGGYSGYGGYGGYGSYFG